MVGALAPLGEGKFPSPPGTQLPPPLSQGGDPGPPQTDPPGCCGSGRGHDFELAFPLIFQTDALGGTPNALIHLYSVCLGILSKKTYLKNICLHRIT